MLLPALLYLFLAYLVGSVPTGYLIARYFFNINILEHGSGNIGATNIARILGRKYFFLIMVLDACKAFLTLICAEQFIGGAPFFLFLAAVALLVGNAYSIFLDFKGGKGVATTLGILLYFAPIWLVISFASIWIAALFLTGGLAFLASLLAMGFVLIVMLILCGISLLSFFFIFLFSWLFFRHTSNITFFINNKKF